MRIAVCRPQVPFARGGVEIFADDLVAELRKRGHEAELVTVPFKWYPGERVLTQAFLWRLLDLDEADGRRDRPRDRDEVPRRTSSGIRTRSSGSSTSSGRPTSSTAPSSGSSASRRRTARPGAGVHALDRVAPRRGAQALRDLAQRRRPARALDRDRRRGDAAPATGAAVPLRRLRRLRPLGRPARPRQAHRPADRGGRGGGFPVVVAGDGPDRERLESARETGRARASSAACPRRSSPTCTRAASPSTTRRWTRTSGWSRTRRSSSEKPVVTTTDAGGPLEVVTRPRDRPRDRAARRGARRRVRGCASTCDEAARLGPCRPRARRARDRGTRRSSASSDRESRLLLAAAARRAPASPTTRALLLPALDERMEVVVAAAGRFRARAGRDVALYHVGNDPQAHGWIVDALRRRPGVVVLHEFVLHHLVAGLTLARGTSTGTSHAMERDAGLDGPPARATRSPTAQIPPLWETQPDGLPARRRGARPRHRARRPLALRRGARARARLPRADLAGSRCRPGRCPASSPPASRGARARLVRAREREQADPAAARARSSGCVRAGRTRGCSSSARCVAPPRRSAPRPRASSARTTCRGRLWALMGACDVIVSLRAPTMGETSAAAIRALSLGKPLVVSDVGWFAELPGEVAVKVPVGEGEIEALARRPRADARREPARWGRRRWRLAGPSTTSSRVADALRGRAPPRRAELEPGRMRVAYYSPMPPSPLGDRRLLRAAAPGARAAASTSSSPGRAASARTRAPTSRSTTSATTPRRTAGSSRRSAAGRASSSCTTSSSTTSSSA